MLSLFSIWADRLRALQGWRRYGAAFLFGAMAALAFPPFNAVAALWFFFPSLVFLLQGATKKRQAFFLGWFFAFGLLTVSLYWIAGALFVDIKQFWWLVPFAVFGLPAMFAVYHGLAALAAWRLDLNRLDGLVVLAVAWSLADYARGTMMTGFPWDLTGYVWSDVLPVLQLASVIGVYGLTLFTLVLAVLPAALVSPVRNRMSLPVFAASLVLLGAAAAWGGWRLSQAPEAFVPGVRLRLVQPDIDQARKWRHDEREANFKELLDLSFAPAEKPVTQIIWPETATAYYLTEDSEARKAIAARMTEGQTLLTGVVQRGLRPDGSLMYFNSLIAVDGKARVVAGYAKFHLVPFGEYVPFRSFLPFRAVAAIGDFTPGDGLMTLRVKGMPSFSPLVCYEAIFPGEVARRDDPPHVLLNVTNDAWYDGTTGPYQHFAIARARAVEEGVPLVRVANKGVNGVVDGYGRIVARQGWGKAAFLDSDLPQALPMPTFFARWGNKLFLILAGIMLAAVLTRGFLTRK
ncbi:MAG: apolipoprotein N-acyltransferase [Alphaproteobacteria bacterium]|nr:apolipoprotein N-acyltransferase [Alphaproteobacteria bacterium]